MLDIHDLARFEKEQVFCYENAVRELKAGRKQTHWMWFVFPQFNGLGTSSTSRKFAIKSVDEARAYVAHPVLGERLIECTDIAMSRPGRTALSLFGSPDDMKFRSCMTLFALVSERDSLFEMALDQFFSGRKDEKTLDLVQAASRLIE